MRYSVIAVIALSLSLGGCISSGAFNTAHLTDVRLAEANYSIVAKNVSGEAWASYILGVSGAVGTEAKTFALVRVGGEKLLYQAAFENLWNNFEEAHGSVEGRHLALTNVRYDSDALNLILFTKPHVSIRADVIEFE